MNRKSIGESYANSHVVEQREFHNLIRGRPFIRSSLEKLKRDRISDMMPLFGNGQEEQLTAYTSLM
jgi:hypothetical protein